MLECFWSRKPHDPPRAAKPVTHPRARFWQSARALALALAGLVAAVPGGSTLADAQSPGAPTAASSTSPAETSPASPPPETTPVARGKYLATIGNCTSCHTRSGGAAFAGGVAFKTDFGTLYSSNITPDRKAGIGGWSLAQFVRAMREGIDDEGEHLYPAFPYPEFSKVSDADLGAIFEYLRTLAPASDVAPANELRFPYNQRSLLALWNTLYFKPAPFRSDPAQTPQWNRGAYLVQGLGHCGACHTPRNFLGAEKSDQALSGGAYLDKVSGNDIRPWSAVNLTSADSGLKRWTVEDIASYLKSGHGTRTGAFGPMNEVIVNSTREWTDADLQAAAVYLKSLAPLESSPNQTLDDKDRNAGETLYTIHCGTCHLPTGLGSSPGSELGPPLVGSAIVQSADPAALINVILYGADVVSPAPAQGWKNMKSFGTLLEDEEVATLANYLRASWNNRGGKVTAADVARQR
jgi:mono/diheme cytochrome c family protein